MAYNRESSEDNSVSSTFEVVASEPHRPKATRGGSKESHVRRVFFDETANKAYQNTKMCREDISPLWWSRTELQDFKSTYVETIKDVIQVEREHRKNPMSYQQIFQRIYNACCEATEEDEKQMTCCELHPYDESAFFYWVSMTADRLGLERVIHRKIVQDRAMRRRQLVQIVEYWQDTAMCNNNTSVENAISLASKEVSRPSRVFAAFLAQAHAAAP